MSAVLQLVEPEFGAGDGGGSKQLICCGECGGIIFNVYTDQTGDCLQCDTEVDFANSEDPQEGK